MKLEMSLYEISLHFNAIGIFQISKHKQANSKIA